MVAKTISEQVEELANKLAVYENEFRRHSEYYDATYRLEAIGIAVPREMQCLTASVGWPRMYLDSIEERLDIEGFRVAGKVEKVKNLTEWWQVNNLDEESGLAHLDALIYGRSYVTVSSPGPNDPEGVPVIRVESPRSMYCETDPRTREVTRAIRIYENDDDTDEKWATLYLPDRTEFLYQFGGKWVQDADPVVHNLGVVPVVPLINRERLAHREGSSEITPEIRSLTDAASRVMMNMQAAAELMAVPQRVLFGVEPEQLAPNGASPSEVMSTYMAQYLAVENEAGKAHQFSAAELQNFVNVLQELAKHIASYTGLPPQYLSFSSENPASAEAIKSSEARLVKKCERKARLFGGAWEQVMRLAMRVMGEDVPKEMYRLQTVWSDPATPTFSSKADAVYKLYDKGEGIITLNRARQDVGYSEEEIEIMKEEDKEVPAARLQAAMGQRASLAAQRQQGAPGTAQTSDPSQQPPSNGGE